MPSISFIYKTKNNTNSTYTGKYVYQGYLDDDQPFDIFVKGKLLECLNNYRFQRGYREFRAGEINVGVLSVMDTVSFNTYKECKAFDFYFNNNIFFLNGRKVHNSEYQSSLSNLHEIKSDSESTVNTISSNNEMP
jgi:hypothetical protein